MGTSRGCFGRCAGERFWVDEWDGGTILADARGLKGLFDAGVCGDDIKFQVSKFRGQSSEGKVQVSKFRGQGSGGREKDEGGEWVGKSRDFMPEFLEPPGGIRLLGNRARRVNVKPLPNNAGLATAILHSLNPAKDFLGVGLADGEGTHWHHFRRAVVTNSEISLPRS